MEHLWTIALINQQKLTIDTVASFTSQVYSSYHNLNICVNWSERNMP